MEHINFFPMRRYRPSSFPIPWIWTSNFLNIARPTQPVLLSKIKEIQLTCCLLLKKKESDERRLENSHLHHEHVVQAGWTQYLRADKFTEYRQLVVAVVELVTSVTTKLKLIHNPIKYPSWKNATNCIILYWTHGDGQGSCWYEKFRHWQIHFWM